MKNYIKTYFGDFILCFFISVGLSLNVFAGYEMKDPWSQNLLMVAAVAVAVTLVLFFAYRNKVTSRISMIVQIVAFIGMMIVLSRTGAFEGSDTIDKSPLLFWILTITTSSVVFWTTRSRMGTVILFLAGTLMTAAFDFLQYPLSKGGYFVFVFCIFILYLYRVYFLSWLHLQEKKINLHSYLIQSICACLLVFLLAASTYYYVIQPLEPPTDEISLSKKLMSLEPLERAGISSKIMISQENNLENQNSTKDSQKEKNKNQQEKIEKEKRQIRHDKKEKNRSSNDFFNAIAITYGKTKHYFWLIGAAVLLLFAGAIPGKLYLRKRWYGNVLAKENEDGIIDLYLYFIEGLKKAGMKRPAHLTLLEHAVWVQEKLDKFTAYDADFLKLTQIYLSVLYGYQKISEQERELFHDFYKEFHRNLKGEMGKFQYCLHFFKI